MTTKRVYIDFESRSQADIWTTGAWRYAEDTTTEILCLAWAVNDGPVKIALRGRQLIAAIQEINALVAEGAEFHAHNAFFERCMWRHQLTPKYGALPIPIKQWRCTAAKAAAHALPRSLEKAALALGCKFNKDMAGHKLMILLSKTTGAIEAEKLVRLGGYCQQDVAVEREIDTKLPDLCPSEQRVWFMDQYINDTGVRIDVAAVGKAIALIKSETEMLNDELFKLTGGLINAGTQREAIKKYLESKGVVLNDLTKGTVKDAITKAGGDNLRILQLRQQLSLSSNAKYAALAAAVSADERVRDMLVYHGASTGRWSGKLFQLHNLVKSLLSPSAVDRAIHILKTEGFETVYDVLPVLSSCIRGMVIPTDGNEAFITDFAAIEARVVMWAAGETKGVQMFEAGDKDTTLPDIYVLMAREIYLNKGITKKDKQKRQLGKQAILGSGFGMGQVKFQATCEKYGVDLGKKTLRLVGRDGGETYISPLAATAVAKYRETFPGVVRYWYATEEAAKRAVGSQVEQPCGKVVWYKDGEFLRCRLPSGRTLAYHHPKINADGKLTFMAVNSTTNQYVVETTWGGTLVENLVQAIARDIMVESMFSLFKAGFHVLFTVHDELVLEAPKGTKTCDDVLKIVRQTPTWAKGCPINAECEKVERYQK